MRRFVGVLVGFAVALVAVGAFGSARAADGLVRTRTVVDGAPLTVVRLSSGGQPRPGAVVVHGFAGSAQLMQPFADTLARNGYVVVLPDLAGHGASTARLTEPESDVDIAVRFLRARSDVDADRIVLVGHSRGAAAVMSYAAGHPEIAATVSISGVAPEIVPRNLLMLYGRFEFPLLSVAAQEMLLRDDPTATVTTGYTYGSFTEGTARRADPVPGVEHVSILFSPAAHAWTLAWLDSAVRPGTAPGAVHALDRLGPAAALLLGLLVGFVALAALLLRRPDSSAPRDAPAGPGELARPALAVVAGLVVAGLVGVVVPEPTLGLAVGGYAAIVLVAFGLAVLVGARVAAVPSTISQLPNMAMLARVAVLAAYAAAMVVVPVQAGLTWVVPSQPRLVPLLALLVAAWLLFAAAERLAAGRWYRHAVVLAASLGLLLALAVVGLGSGFLVLILPLVAGVLAIGAGVAAVLRRYTVPPWLIAFVAAPPFAWIAATTLPLA